MKSPKRLLALLALLPVLSGCDLFNPKNPISDVCYTNPQPGSASAGLALGAGGADYVPSRLLVSYQGSSRAAAFRPQDEQLERTTSPVKSARDVAADVRRRYHLEALSVLSDPALSDPALSDSASEPAQPSPADTDPSVGAQGAEDSSLGSSITEHTDNDYDTDYLSEVVSVPEGVNVTELAAEMERDPRVRYAEPDLYLRPLSVAEPDLPDDPDLPNDPDLFEQWHLLEFGLPQAWRLETGNAGIVIAVLDSGVDLTHEDLRGRILPGCDLFNSDNDPSPGPPGQLGDNQRHGTHVAGIALAGGDNGKGVAGVAYGGVRLLPVKVFDDGGESQFTSSSVVATAIRWSAGLSVEGLNRTPYPAQVINLSLGGKGNVQTLNDAVRDARRAGSLVVAASGNGFSSEAIFAPANAPEALAVGSVDANYQRSDFSNYSTTGRTVDLMAPGGVGDSSCGGVYSTISPTFEGMTESAYGCERGTSMAAPFVAGVAALLWSQNPELSDDEVEAKLLSSARYTPAMNPAEYGAGVVCADRALGAATLCGR